MATSVQDSQPPQATGIAARTARNGVITNAYRAIRTPRDCGPSVRGLGPLVVAGSITDVMAPHRTAEINYLRLRHRNLRCRKSPRLRPDTQPEFTLAHLQTYL